MRLRNNAIATSLIFLGAAGAAHADQASQLVGSWCFYEQSAFSGTTLASTVPEKVDITFYKNGYYQWQEGVFKQSGTWKIEKDSLVMSDIGKHDIISVSDDAMELKRFSTMKFKKSTCGESGFSDQDVIRFQNAASVGDSDVIKNYLDKGMQVDILDWRSNDTALIKAAKFCKVGVATQLIGKGADKKIVNGEEKIALDYAKSSNFHQGCSALVTLLK